MALNPSKSLINHARDNRLKRNEHLRVGFTTAPPHLGRQVAAAIHVIQKAIVAGVLYAPEEHDSLGTAVVFDA